MIISTHGIIQGRAAAPASDIVTTNLALYMDASKTTSYPGTGTDVYNIAPATPVLGATMLNSLGFSTDFGGVFRFNGTDQRLVNSSTFPYSNGYTIQIMYKCNNLSNKFQTLMSARTDSTNFFLGADTDYYIFEAQNGYEQFTPNVFNVTTWRFLTVINRGDVNGTKIYLNDSTTLYTNTKGRSGSGSYNLGIATFGLDTNAAARRFTGDIQAILFYNKELTTAEIAQNFNALKKAGVTYG
jgi:hypothetical protein